MYACSKQTMRAIIAITNAYLYGRYTTITDLTAVTHGNGRARTSYKTIDKAIHVKIR